MVINRNHSQNTNRVEFISYTGEYPNLCSGVLTVKIDGEEVRFGHNYSLSDLKWIGTDKCNDGNYDQFWHSGGSVCGNDDGDFDVEQAEWEIDVEELDPKFWDVADELDRVINENIPYGCCGGCI